MRRDAQYRFFQHCSRLTRSDQITSPTTAFFFFFSVFIDGVQKGVDMALVNESKMVSYY